MSLYKKPLPTVNNLNSPFWNAAKEKTIKMQFCSNCGHFRYPIAPACPKCISTNFTWGEVGKTGEIWSFSIFHKNYFEGFEEEIPYNVAVIKLDNGVKLISNIVGINNEDLKIGTRVEAYFEDVTETNTIIKFKPLNE